MSRPRQGQQMARVNVDDKTWTRFRIRALRRDRSIADYLAELVRRELDGNRGRYDRAKSTEPGDQEQKGPRGRTSAEKPGPTSKPPPWEL